MKLNAGKTVMKSGDNCHQLYFLINGSLKVRSFADDYGYHVEEQISAPYIIQLEAVFGYNQRYTRDFIAQTDVNFLTLDKEEVVRLTEDFLVFRLNMINHFATQTQKQMRQVWYRAPQSLEDRVVRFLTQRCLYPAGHKTFNILMTRLAEEVNDSRLNVSRILNDMQHRGLIELSRARTAPVFEEACMESTIVSTHRREARSPAAWPPMPSATIRRPASVPTLWLEA